MIDALYALFLLATLVGLAHWLGSAALARVRSWSGGVEQSIFAVAVGMGIIGFAVLALGLLGLLHPAAFWVFPALGSGGLLLGARRGLAARTTAVEDDHSPLRPAGAIMLAAFGLLTLIGALAPPGGLEWDALSYHLAVPKIYLREGRIFYVPWVSHSNFPFTLQMLYTLMLGLGSIGAAKLCHWLCGVLLVLSVYTFAVRHFAPAPRARLIGLIAALTVAATPIVLWEASVAYVDLATALFTWLSLYALFNAAQASGAAEKVRPDSPASSPQPPASSPVTGRGRERRKKRGPLSPNNGGPEGAGSVPWLVVSAVMMGLALGTKYTVLGFWGMLLVGVLAWHLLSTGRWAKETLPHAALWGGVSLLVAAPWYVKTWLYTGNPVYPFYYGLFGGRYWNAANAALYTADQAKFGFGKTPIDLLLAPWQVTMEAGFVTPQKPFLFTEYVVFGLSPVYVGLLLAAPLLARRLSRASALLALFGLGVFGFWFFLMQQTRYLIPALPALALVSAEALVAAWDELPLARWGGAALVALSVVSGLYLAATGIAAPALPVVTGQVTREAFIARRPPGVGPAVAYINRETPPDAKVALFDETRGFYLDRDYLWATPNHATLLPWDRYGSADEWLADFKRRGYTTLLVNEATPAPNDGQRWRVWLPEAVAAGKVTPVFEQPLGPTQTVRVYRIP